jgi:hypothetical protein
LIGFVELDAIMELMHEFVQFERIDFTAFPPAELNVKFTECPAQVSVVGDARPFPNKAFNSPGTVLHWRVPRWNLALPHMRFLGGAITIAESQHSLPDFTERFVEGKLFAEHPSGLFAVRPRRGAWRFAAVMSG